jgi:hypothetical protein
MARIRKILSPEELIIKQEADYLRKKKSNLAWRQTHPEHYEYFKSTYMKKYYEEHKDKLNAQSKERRMKKLALEAELMKSTEQNLSTSEFSSLPIVV